MRGKKVYLYVFLLVILSFFCIVLYQSSRDIKTVYTVKYKEKSYVDYKVYLKDNNYYSEEYLPSNMEYVSDLIDYIDVSFLYEVNASNVQEPFNNYYVKANLKVEKDDKVLFTKDYLYGKIVTQNFVGNKLNLDRDVKVDYQEYRKIVNSLLEEYSIDSSVNSTLVLGLYIINDYNIGVENNDSKSMKVIIPINNDTINISISKNNINDNKEVYYNVKESVASEVLLGLFFVFLFFDVIVLIILIIYMSKKNNYGKKEYSNILNKMLKKYDKDIIDVVSIPDMRGYDVYEVKSFDELLELKNTIKKPINHLVIEKNKKDLFFIELDNKMYEYLMKTKK